LLIGQVIIVKIWKLLSIIWQKLRRHNDARKKWRKELLM